MSSSYVSQIITNIFKYNNLEIYCIKSDEYNIWFGAAEIAKGFNYQNINQTIKNKVNNEECHKRNMLAGEHVSFVACVESQNVAGNILTFNGQN